MTTRQLFTIFNNHPDEWLSGAHLAEELGISRTAIWKQIQQLKKQGHDIVSHQGLGYQYRASAKLNAPAILAHLSQYPDVVCQVFEELDSTNDYAKAYLSQHPKLSPTVILAEKQTRGRGRLGRQFYSPANTGLYMSILLTLKPGQEVHPSLLTTGTGTAVVRAIRKLYPDLMVALKWINDLVIHQRKCGGILTEAITDLESGQISHLIVGIGLNISTSEFPDDLTQIAGALSDERLDRNRLAAEILEQFFAMYQTYQNGDFLPDYRRFSAILNHPVLVQTVQTQGKTLSGTVVDFDYQGYLVLKDSSGQKITVQGGEVTKVTSD